MKKKLSNIVSSCTLLTLFISQCVFSQPLEKEVFEMLLSPQSEANLQESKQFIGPSVIGGLMWPVLLTLTVTGILARIPDALQRLLSIGGGGSYQYRTLHKRSAHSQEHLDRIMKSLLLALDAMENIDSEPNAQTK